VGHNEGSRSPLAQTRALLKGSLTIDMGDDTGAPTTDQRGDARPRRKKGSKITDIGDFEL
jgi:hypothetical protein